MESLTYNVVIEPLVECGYGVTVPALSGCFTWGRTYQEAVEMAKDAITGYLRALQKCGEPIPIEEPQVPVAIGLSVRFPKTA